MQKVTTIKVRVPSESTKDSGAVRFGAVSPSMPATRQAPASTADTSKVRFGAVSPSMPKTR